MEEFCGCDGESVLVLYIARVAGDSAVVMGEIPSPNDIMEFAFYIT